MARRSPTPIGGKKGDACLRCGRCCHEKIRAGRDVVITDIPCPHLDAATRLCTVYAERFRHQPHCSTADASARAGGMPGDCPYAQTIAGYRPPLLLADHPEFAAEVDACFPGRSRLATRWLAEAEAGAADGVRPEDAFPDPGRRSDLG